jgi:hypothetical protein
MSQTETQDLELIEALEQSSCHEDLVAFVEKAQDHHNTPSVLETLERFHDGADGVEKFLKYGTRKEELLWNNGAAVALERIGNWDVRNKPVLEAVVEDRALSRDEGE